MKWVLGILAILALAMGGSWVWAGQGQRSLDDPERTKAPGQFADTQAGRIHYQLSGPEGAPLIVMVHGFSTPGFIFDQNAAALRGAGFRTLQFDHLGRGWSDRPATKYDMDFYDGELTGLLDTLGFTEPVGLAGLSMGGPIVAEFAVRHPERVKSVFLFVPAGFDVAGPEGLQATLLGIPVLGDWLWHVLALKSIAADPQYDETGLAPENRLQGDVRAQMAYKGYGHALLSTIRHFPMRDREETFAALARTGIPVAAVFGTADPTVLIASADRLRAAAPEASIHILDGADHGLNYKRHTEVNPILTGWFETTAR